MRVFENRDVRSFLWTVVLCAIACIAILAIKPPEVNGQCPGENCPTVRQPAPSVDVGVRVRKRPTDAWRYENPTGHRQSVVRVFCKDTARVSSIGSGVLVKWGRKLVVLTARHVVQDAKSIIVETFRKKTYKAHVIKVDRKWDCAVLELEGTPDVAAAEIEWGEAAMQREGNRLESCGYGADGKLASNNGLFIGYKRSSEDNHPPDDWMELSGPARGGDSGGPIFNDKGRVVGVLWGTTGDVVVGVQAGRLHILLNAALPPVKQQVYVQLQYRQPTPAMPGPVTPIEDLPDATTGCGPNGCAPGANCEQAAQGQKNPLLPWRGGAEARDNSLDARTKALLDALEAEKKAREAGDQQKPPPQVVIVPEQPKEEPKIEPAKAELSPLLAGLCVLGAVVAGFVVYFVGAKG